MGDAQGHVFFYGLLHPYWLALQDHRFLPINPERLELGQCCPWRSFQQYMGNIHVAWRSSSVQGAQRTFQNLISLAPEEPGELGTC